MCVVQFALKMGLVSQKQSMSTVFYMQSLVPYSKVGLNKTTSVQCPALITCANTSFHKITHLYSQRSSIDSYIQHNRTEVNDIAIAILFKCA